MEDQVESSISTIEDRIPRWLKYCCKMCCEKGGCYERQALIVGKECTVEMCILDGVIEHFGH